MGRNLFGYLSDSIFNVLGVAAIVASAARAGIVTATDPFAFLAPLYLVVLAVFFVAGFIRKVQSTGNN